MSTANSDKIRVLNGAIEMLDLLLARRGRGVCVEELSGAEGRWRGGIPKHLRGAIENDGFTRTELSSKQYVIQRWKLAVTPAKARQRRNVLAAKLARIEGLEATPAN